MPMIYINAPRSGFPASRNTIALICDPARRSECCRRPDLPGRGERTRESEVVVTEDPPSAFGIISELENPQVLLTHHAELPQPLEVDQASPIVFVHEQDRDWRHLAGLFQGENLEQLVEGAEPARKHDQRVRAHREMHLAHR